MPELERVRRGHGEEVPVGEPPLDLPAVLREVARAVGTIRSRSGRVAHLPPGELREQLGRPPGPREPDRPDVRSSTSSPISHGRLGEGAPPPPGLLVDDRRVPQGEELVAGGAAAVLDDSSTSRPVRRAASSPGLPTVALARHQRGLAAVVRDQAPEPPQHHRDVRAEHAAAHVRLVDHDERETEEEVRPPRVVGQDRQMEHVGVRQHEVRVLPDQRPLGLRRVAVVGGRPDLRELQRRGRRGADRARGPSSGTGTARWPSARADGRLGERDVVDERLPARGAGRQDHVAPARSASSPRDWCG